MKILKKYLIGLLVFLISGSDSFSRAESEFSFVNVQTTQVQPALNDTNTVLQLHQRASEFLTKGLFGDAMKSIEKAISISENLLSSYKGIYLRSIKRYLAISRGILGHAYEAQGDYQNALIQQFKSLKIREEIGAIRGVADSHSNIGRIYLQQGKYPEALTENLMALKTCEARKDTEGIAFATLNIGQVYEKQNNFSKALEYYFLVLNLYEKSKDEDGIAIIEINIANIYDEQNDSEKALMYNFKALKIKEKMKDSLGMSMVFNNVGVIYKRLENYTLALDYFEKSLKIKKGLNSKTGVAVSSLNIADVNIQELIKNPKNYSQKKRDQTLAYLNDAMAISKSIGNIELIMEGYGCYSSFDETIGNYKESMEKYKLYIKYRDSLLNEENTKKLVQAEMNYVFDKKEAALRLEQEKKDVIALEENQKQRIIRNSFIAGFVLMMVLAFFIFRSFRQKQKSNKIISIQKREVEKQKSLVEQKQLQIVDSINYAKRIQESVLIPEEEIKKQLPELFVLYIPKDIVSGDFYWFSEVEKNEILLVVADCTGHGVPGAFLSMIGSTLLNEIVTHNQITDPAKIINELAKGLSSTLVNKGKKEENTDGMDISICKVNPKEKKISFAGANQMLYIVNEAGIKKVEAQISSINGIFGLGKDEIINSANLNLDAGSMVYLSTDGYADQIGQKAMKKFLASRFEKLISEIHTLPIEEQKKRLFENFKDWKGKMNQIDDVLVLGFKV